MITVHSNGLEAKIDIRHFPAGESFIKIEDFLRINNPGSIAITLNFESNDDLFNLALVVDALRRKYGSKGPQHLSLVMPYLPYARQDRVMSTGESLSIKVLCDFINNLNFNEVVCWNVHSDVGVALLNNLRHIPLSGLVQLNPTFDKENTILVSPDAGANKKVFDLAHKLGFDNVVRADKTRDVKTGKISGTVVYSEHVGSKNFLIVDDICDGGRTFIELAKELRELTDGKIMLYVTHGIFSAGAEVFDGLIDEIYVSNLVGKKAHEAVNSSNKIQVIP